MCLFRRAEEVLDEIGLRHRADVVVGGLGGGGLSGGQKRLLMFGIEIITKPAVLFLVWRWVLLCGLSVRLRAVGRANLWPG